MSVLCHVVFAAEWRKAPSVSDTKQRHLVIATETFRPLKMKSSCSFETTRTDYPTTRRHIPEKESYPISGLGRPLGLQDAEVSRISRQPVPEDGGVVSPIPATTFARQKTYVVLSRTEGHSVAVRIKSMKKNPVTPSDPRPPGLLHSTSTNCATACPKHPRLGPQRSINIRQIHIVPGVSGVQSFCFKINLLGKFDNVKFVHQIIHGSVKFGCCLHLQEQCR